MKTYTYTVLYQYFREDSQQGYNVLIPAIPDIVTWGKTLEEAKANAREAIQCHLEGLIMDGEPVPEDVRTEELFEIEKVPVSV